VSQEIKERFLRREEDLTTCPKGNKKKARVLSGVGAKPRRKKSSSENGGGEHARSREGLGAVTRSNQVVLRRKHEKKRNEPRGGLSEGILQAI